MEKLRGKLWEGRAVDGKLKYIWSGLSVFFFLLSQLSQGVVGKLSIFIVGVLVEINARAIYSG